MESLEIPELLPARDMSRSPESAGRLDAVENAGRASAPPVELCSMTTELPRYSQIPMARMDKSPLQHPTETQKPVSVSGCHSAPDTCERPSSEIDDLDMLPPSRYAGPSPPLPLGLPSELEQVSTKDTASEHALRSPESTEDDGKRTSSESVASRDPRKYVLSWLDSDGKKQESRLEFRFGSASLPGVAPWPNLT